MGALASLLLSITGSVTARVLTSIGIGIFSFTAMVTVVNNAVSAAQVAYNSNAGIALAFLNMSGTGEAFGIISAALISRASLMAIQKYLRPY